MELRQLYYFVAVADTLNFSRAAQALYVSQSALSKQIAGLEEELGVLLFSRSRQRRVALTAAGETLLHEAKEILLRSEKIAPLLHKSPQNCRETKRSLFIVVEPRVAEDPRVHALLTDAVYEQRRAYPGLRALFRQNDFGRMLEALREGEQDMGIFLHQTQQIDDALETLTLREEEMVLVVRRRQPCKDTIEQGRELLDQRGIVLLEKESRGLSQILHLLQQIGSTPKIRFCEDHTAMTLTVESGESAMILPQSAADRLSGTDLQILHFQHPAAKLYLSAAWYRGCQNEMVYQVADRLRRAFEKEQQTGIAET